MSPRRHLGALIWVADKLKSDEREKALGLWAEKGKSAFRGIEPDGITCHRRSTITVRAIGRRDLNP